MQKRNHKILQNEVEKLFFSHDILNLSIAEFLFPFGLLTHSEAS